MVSIELPSSVLKKLAAVYIRDKIADRYGFAPLGEGVDEVYGDFLADVAIRTSMGLAIAKLFFARPAEADLEALSSALDRISPLEGWAIAPQVVAKERALTPRYISENRYLTPVLRLDNWESVRSHIEQRYTVHIVSVDELPRLELIQR